MTQSGDIEIITPEIKSFVVATVLGMILGALNLPIPAPPTIAGVLGVAGIYCGYTFWMML